MPSPTPRLRGRKGQEQRQRRLRRTDYLCEWCRAKGITRIADQVDHIIPLKDGGPDTDANTQNLCGPCHEEKTRQDMNYRERVKFESGRVVW